jgi:hypothetical protein
MDIRREQHILTDRGTNIPTSGIADFVDGVKDSLDHIHDAIKILSLGIDYRKFAKFCLYTPTVLWTQSGKPLIPKADRPPERMPSVESVQFCINFVVGSATVIQESSFS